MDDRQSASEPQGFASMSNRGRKKLVGKIDEMLEQEKQAMVDKIVGPRSGPRPYHPPVLRDSERRAGRPGDIDDRNRQRGSAAWEAVAYAGLFAFLLVVTFVVYNYAAARAAHGH